MKTIITILLVALSTTVFSSKYEEAMKTNIDKLHSLTSSVELQALANQFERIGNAEQDKWLPAYYSAYCFVRSTFFDEMEADDKHKQLDKAQNIIDRLQKKQENESEVYALQALVYQLRITDMSKGAKYSMKTSDGKDYLLDQSLELIEGMIDPKQFFRINRKYLVALKSICDVIAYSNSRLKLKISSNSDDDFLVAREKVKAFKSWLEGSF